MSSYDSKQTFMAFGWSFSGTLEFLSSASPQNLLETTTSHPCALCCPGHGLGRTCCVRNPVKSH
jgi:hypothetical protein